MGKGITQSRVEAFTARNRRLWEQAKEGAKTRELSQKHGVSRRTTQRVTQAARGCGRVMAARRPGPKRGSVNRITPAVQAQAKAAAFLDELRAAYPGTVRGLQTDNGSEFAGHFKSACKAAGLPLIHAWVNCPDQNGKVERFNRILRDETMLGANDHTLSDAALIADLARFLHLYNYDRPHSSHDWNSLALYLASEFLPQACPPYATLAMDPYDRSA